MLEGYKHRRLRYGLSLLESLLPLGIAMFLGIAAL